MSSIDGGGADAAGGAGSALAPKSGIPPGIPPPGAPPIPPKSGCEGRRQKTKGNAKEKGKESIRHIRQELKIMKA